ncbi:MAG TPA: TetR/AcrR family transcriptional regulator [Rubrobacteraceae bacterium]|nr:TetR/AcrR family transcriptional regulator [Rubrobacteraceae bacterium]
MLVKESVGKVGKRVDPRVKRTRALIVGAFNELVAEKGHAGLTVQEIAERATVNRATFYAHFADQYELFDCAISEAFREELRQRLPASRGLSRENLRALVLAACDYLAGLNKACSRTDRQFRPLIEARVQGELYELLLGWIEASVRRVDGRSISPDVTASVVSWAIFGAALDWSRNGAAPSSEEVADQVLSVVVGGLDGSVSLPARIS